MIREEFLKLITYLYFTSHPALAAVGVHKPSDLEMCAEFSFWNEILKECRIYKIFQGYYPGESVVESQLWENCCVYIIKVEPDNRKMHLPSSKP